MTPKESAFFIVVIAAFLMGFIHGYVMAYYKRKKSFTEPSVGERARRVLLRQRNKPWG